MHETLMDGILMMGRTGSGGLTDQVRSPHHYQNQDSADLSDLHLMKCTSRCVGAQRCSQGSLPLVQETELHFPSQGKSTLYKNLLDLVWSPPVISLLHPTGGRL